MLASRSMERLAASVGTIAVLLPVCTDNRTAGAGPGRPCRAPVGRPGEGAVSTQRRYLAAAAGTGVRHQSVEATWRMPSA